MVTEVYCRLDDCIYWKNNRCLKESIIIGKMFGCIDKINKKNVDYIKEELCLHCGYPIKIRNPSGYCDHLYYPESCGVCKLLESNNKTIIDLKNRVKELENSFHKDDKMMKFGDRPIMFDESNFIFTSKSGKRK
jgi:hypothetical protein